MILNGCYAKIGTFTNVMHFLLMLVKRTIQKANYQLYINSVPASIVELSHIFIHRMTSIHVKSA